MHAVLARLSTPTIQRPRNLQVDYHPDMPAGLINQLEQAARNYGLPLADLELLGQHPGFANDFICAVHEGGPEAFLGCVDWAYLESRLHGRVAN